MSETFEMETPVIDQRPWGRFIKFSQNSMNTVKIIEIKPGQQLSTKTHTNRDEMWIALDQGLVALVGDETVFMKDMELEIEPVWVPRGTTHSLKNVNAGLDARLLEISFGEFDENDFKRIRDEYGRV
jgi:mannose-1-phosphate guanylyltransferase/mannose-6-phosphate isomerase